MIIDAHAHFFSRPFFATLAGGDEDKLTALSAKTGIEIPPADTAAHLKRWLAELDANDVAHMVTFASLPEEAPTVAEAVGLAEGRLSACTLVNPNVAGSEKLAAQPAFSGVILFPAMHHYHVAEAQAVLEVADEREALVYVHCGLLVVKLRDLLGLPRPYDLAYANPLSVIPAANRYRRAKFIIPHFGAGFFRETLMAGLQCENLFVDTSSSNSWMQTQAEAVTLRDVFSRTLEVFGPERILFGTDSNVFPAGWRRERLDEQQALLADLGMATDDQQLILAGNIRRLLGI